MTGLDLLLAVAGVAVTMMVIAGMILITPRGQVEAEREVDDASRVDVVPGLDGRGPRPEPVPRAAGGETPA